VPCVQPIPVYICTHASGLASTVASSPGPPDDDDGPHAATTSAKTKVRMRELYAGRRGRRSK